MKTVAVLLLSLLAERGTGGGTPQVTVTARSGEYAFDRVQPGPYQLSFTLINFASLTRRDVAVQSGETRVDVVLHLSLNAEVTARRQLPISWQSNRPRWTASVRGGCSNVACLA